MLYAIGEIALVVIGILIALQINNWNEWRKEGIKENKLLYDLVETLNSIRAISMRSFQTSRQITDQVTSSFPLLKTNYHKMIRSIIILPER